MAAKKKASAKTTKRTAGTAKRPTPKKEPPTLPVIGKPATRALAAIGVVRLEQVTRFTEDELLELHGVGPRAIRILGEALSEHGKAFKQRR
ncbi:MAG: DNA-binding protein [Labilithrix sp.]|nr:DNA-binding protein [Labilithrix sp.]